MKRRRFVSLCGAAAVGGIAGCTDAIGDGVESATGPEYDPDTDVNDLLPRTMPDDAPSNSLVANHDANDNWRRVWASEDEAVIVMLDARVDESVSAAQDNMEAERATAGNSASNYPLGDDAVIYSNDRSARLMVRDSNLRMQVLGAMVSGAEPEPDRQRASGYASTFLAAIQENYQQQ